MIQAKHLRSLMLGDGGVVQAEPHFACSLPSAGRRVRVPCAGTMPGDWAALLGLESSGPKWLAHYFKFSPLVAFFRGKDLIRVATVPAGAVDFYSISFSSQLINVALAGARQLKLTLAAFVYHSLLHLCY